MPISSVLGSSALLPAGLGFRNVLINGGFDVWQRSTDATIVGADNYFAPDRWRGRTAAGGGSLRVSRQLSGLSGSTYCARVQRTSGNTNTNQLQLIQTVETQNATPFAGAQATISFYARAGANYSPTASALRVETTCGTGLDQYWLSFSNGVALVNKTVSLTSTWQKFTFTMFVPSVATQLFVAFEMNPNGTAGVNDYFELTQVQLESNTQPTTFEQRPVGIELTLCHRYYQRMVDPAGAGVSGGSVVARTLLPLYTKMRASPTSTLSGTINFWNGATAVTCTSINTVYNSVSQGQIDFIATIGSQGQAIMLYTTGGSQYIDFSAEL